MEHNTILLDDIELYYRELPENKKELVSNLIKSNEYLVCAVSTKAPGAFLGISGDDSMIGTVIIDIIAYCKEQFGEVWLKNLLKNLSYRME
jgi:hypothetical protein